MGVIKWFNSLFAEDEEEEILEEGNNTPQDDAENQPNQTPEQTSPETTAEHDQSNGVGTETIEGIFASNIKNAESIVDTDYWWCFPGHYESDVSDHNLIDADNVISRTRLEMNERKFPLMDIPTNIIRVLKLLEAPNFEYSDVATLVEHSPGMAGEILKVVNSSAMNRGEAIHSLTSALPRLGRDKIKSMLYLYSAKLNFKTDPLFFSLAEKIIDHSYAVGIIASYLSQRFYPDQEEAFLAGLLHDIGKLALLKALTVTYELPEKVDYEITEDYFYKIFTIMHEDVGGYVAAHWRLDDLVRSAIINHNRMEFTEDQSEREVNLTCLINISDTMARIIGKGRISGEVNVFDTEAAKRLGWTKDWSMLEFLDCVPELVEL